MAEEVLARLADAIEATMGHLPHKSRAKIPRGQRPALFDLKVPSQGGAGEVVRRP